MEPLLARPSGGVRERVEVELASDRQRRPQRPAEEPPDPETMGWKVDDFVSLAGLSGYVDGDRSGLATRALALAAQPSSGLLTKHRTHAECRANCGPQRLRWSD